jgi:putative glutamine amidotransferase
MRHLKIIDALVLTGGVDIDPYLFGEPPIPQQGTIDPLRDTYELKLTKQALEQGKPLLAICRGCQVLNVAAGGTLYQDLNAQVKNSMKHSQQAPTWYGSHPVDLREGSRLHGVYGKERVTTNSFHHQGVKNTAPGFTETAWSEDGVVEGIEQDGGAWVVGVQWHPERMIDGEHFKIFQALVKAV